MSRVFVTGSAGGLGKAAASALLEQGHEVVIHARSQRRMKEASNLIERGASAVIGDLADRQETIGVAQEINRLGPMDAVIHNAGVYTGRDILAVNVIAPYLLTALIRSPSRLVYLSSNMHLSGRKSLEGLDHGHLKSPRLSYSDSKLLVTTFAVAVSRLWTGVPSNAVDPGWVPTRMGGPAAPDRLDLGHVTQVWLAVSSEPAAQATGGYWYHLRQRPAHPAVNDLRFQDRLLTALAQATGVALD